MINSFAVSVTIVCGAMRKKWAVDPAQIKTFVVVGWEYRVELTLVPAKRSLRLQRLPKAIEGVFVQQTDGPPVREHLCWLVVHPC